MLSDHFLEKKRILNSQYFNYLPIPIHKIEAHSRNQYQLNSMNSELIRNRIRQCEPVIGVTKNRLRLGVVDPASRTAHRLKLYRIHLVLISGVSFYFAQRKGKIIEVQTFESLYCSFICFLLIIAPFSITRPELVSNLFLS